VLAVLLALPALNGCESRSETTLARPGDSAAAGIGPIEFGIWAMDFGGEMYFVPATNIPNVEDQPYGWRVRVGDSKSVVRWTETLSRPGAPDSRDAVATDPGAIVSADGRTVITAMEMVPEDGYVEHSWYVAAGDLPGRYDVTVELPGRRPESWSFRVGDELDNVMPERAAWR
jgi:hypothetical protein